MHDRIETPGGGTILFVGMADHTAVSIKSLENCRIVWVEEAQTLSARSLALLRPTIRTDDSQIWFSWNPRRKSDAVDEFLPTQKPDNAIVVRANWRDNPWFPSVLEEEPISVSIPTAIRMCGRVTTREPSRGLTSREC
jgi:phage terminase large subunit